MKQHFILMAEYNRWANRRLYAAAEDVSDDKLWADKGAFFGSLMGTLNHILVGDRLWLARFRGEPTPPVRLNTVLYRDLPSLRVARESEDEAILAFVNGLDQDLLPGALAYRTLNGTPSETPFAATLAHVFNHQTHHRGQAHALITALGEHTADTDLAFILD